MKKMYLFVSLTIMLGTSCKKSYTCDCISTYTFMNQGTFETKSFPDQKSKVEEKLSKKQASAVCNHEREAIETSLTNGITNNGKTPFKQGETLSTNCSVITN